MDLSPLLIPRSECDPDGDVTVRRVEKVFRLTRLVAELTIGGRLIETTAEHPFYVPGKGWRRTHELEPGDHLVGHDGKLTAVDSVALTVRTAAVYNLRVATDHTYFVGDPNWGFTIWAHNAYSVRQIDDATWGVWDDIKNAFVKNGDNAASYADPDAAKIAADAGNDAIKASVEAAISAAPNSVPQWNLGANHSAQQWANKLDKRGWTSQQIEEALVKGEQFVAKNLVNPANPATRFVHPVTGRSIVRDNVTGEILHIGGDGFAY